MRRLHFAMAFLPLVVFGCSKKHENADGSAVPVAAPTSEKEIDSNEEFTILVRPFTKGDSYSVVREEFELHDESRGEIVVPWSLVRRFKYTESITDLSQGSSLPSELSRAYQKAEHAWNGKRETSPIVGKTVFIKKKGEFFEFRTADEKPVPPGLHVVDLSRQFNRMNQAEMAQLEDIVPRSPVRIDQTWSLDPSALSKLSAHTHHRPEWKEGEGTGRLVRVFDREDKRWGEIELTVRLPPGRAERPRASGLITIDERIQFPIDGSSRDLSMWRKVVYTIRGEAWER